MAVKFRLNSPGVRALLTSEKMRANLHRRAEQVAAAAQPELERLDATYPALDVSSTTGTNRASAVVAGVPAPLERSRRILGAAIDAAR